MFVEFMLKNDVEGMRLNLDLSDSYVKPRWGMLLRFLKHKKKI